MKTIAAGAIIVFYLAAVDSVLAEHDFKNGVRPKDRLGYYHRAREYRLQPYAVPDGTPRPLDRRDPSRPGGLDPSFNPPPT